jgi:hypothetical protein
MAIIQKSIAGNSSSPSPFALSTSQIHAKPKAHLFLYSFRCDFILLAADFSCHVSFSFIHLSYDSHCFSLILPTGSENRLFIHVFSFYWNFLIMSFHLLHSSLFFVFISYSFILFTPWGIMFENLSLITSF